MLVCFVPCLLLGVGLGYLGHVHPHALESSLVRPFVTLFGVAWYSYVLFFVVLPRLLDVGLPSLCVILAVVPGVNVALGLIALFAPTGWWLRQRSG